MDKNSALKESLGNFLRTLGDLMLLNWIWILCCLPLVTVGPATCAMLSVTLRLARKEEVYTLKDYFRSFRSNFRPALLMGLLAAALLVLSAGDIFFSLNITGGYRTLYLVVGMVMGAVFLTVLSYGFALLAMFDNPLKIQLANAFKLAFVAPGKTVAMWMIWMFPVLTLLMLPAAITREAGFLYILFGVSGPAFLCSRILRNVFDKVNGGPVIPE